MGRGAFQQAKGPEARCAPRAPGCGNKVFSSNSGARNRTARRSSIAGHRAIKTLSIPCKFGAVLPCQSPKYDRSEGAAVAVRDHSLAPWPAGAGIDGAQGRIATRQAFVLTPTRWGARRVAASLCEGSGSGGAVLYRTATEPPQNRQPLENLTNCARFSRFYATASRDAREAVCVCAPVCVQLRVYVRGANHRTIEPLVYIYSNQVIRGSRPVLARFWSEPGCGGTLHPRGSARSPNKLAGGYRGAPVELVPIGACSTVLRARGAQSFGDFGRGPGDGRRIGGCARAADLGDLGRIQSSDGNGGSLPFMGWSTARVGRVMLEGWTLRPGLAWFAGERPLPVSLGAGCEAGGGRAALAAPPLPPSRRPRCSSTLALAADRTWIGLPGGAAHCRVELTAQKIAKVGVTATGRGRPGWAAAGMQRRAGVQAEGLEGREPRENRHASAGGCHVNR